MMNIKATLLTFVLTLFSGAALSGSGHDHDHGHSHEPVTQQKAEEIASRVVSTMAKKGVIDKSWDGTKVQKSEQKQFDGRSEWVVSYNNETVSEAEKRTLYIFLTLTGDYLAANYTGK